MRFKCLIVDHDDTAVDSTAAIHYPSYVEAIVRSAAFCGAPPHRSGLARLRQVKLRPGCTPVSLKEFMFYNHSIGFTAFLKSKMG
jgi:hypothetical protein